VENHTLADRLFVESAVLTVERCHLVFVVCVQSLHLQLVVTEIYIGNIVWHEAYWQSPWYRPAQTQYDNSSCSTAYLSHHQTSKSKQQHQHQLCCIYRTAMLTVQ